MAPSQGKDNNSVLPLAEQVILLQEKVEKLTARLDRLEGSKEPVPTHLTSQPGPHVSIQLEEGVIPKVDHGALLPRIAAVCFLLVIALILRTVTDNEIISHQIGSVLGLTYGAFLIGVGWWLYSRKSRLSPVFPSCGMLLLFSIVYETHSRFESLSSFWAYSILLVTSIIAVILSLRYRAAMLICLGTLGTAFVGMVINFPYPFFPFLGVILIVANIASVLANRRQMCLFLRYVTLAFSAIFWLLWSFKLNVPATCDEPTADLLYLSWFFPVLFVFWGVYFAMVVANTMNKELELGFYEGILPTISAVGAFVAGLAVVGRWYGDGTWLGMTALMFAGIHFLVAWWLAGRNVDGASGSNSFTFAGVCLLAIGLAAAVDDVVWVLPMWSGLAYILAILSAKWRSGGVRVTSYLLQMVACGFGAATGVFSVDANLPLVAGLAALTISIVSLMQYRWSRQHAPDTNHSAYFSWLDKKDISAVILLVAGLISGFYFAQLGLYGIVSRLMAEHGAVLQSGRSVFINAGAVLLMVFALRKRNTEIITVAGVVALLGAVKVFILDLFGIKGVPLVVSVFSFGIVAAVASVVMSRWQKKEAKAR
jgi:hypothetical protein